MVPHNDTFNILQPHKWYWYCLPVWLVVDERPGIHRSLSAGNLSHWNISGHGNPYLFMYPSHDLCTPSQRDLQGRITLSRQIGENREQRKICVSAWQRTPTNGFQLDACCVASSKLSCSRTLGILIELYPMFWQRVIFDGIGTHLGCSILPELTDHILSKFSSNSKNSPPIIMATSACTTKTRNMLPSSYAFSVEQSVLWAEICTFTAAFL